MQSDANHTRLLHMTCVGFKALTLAKHQKVSLRSLVMTYYEYVSTPHPVSLDWLLIYTLLITSLPLIRIPEKKYLDFDDFSTGGCFSVCTLCDEGTSTSESLEKSVQLTTKHDTQFTKSCLPHFVLSHSHFPVISSASYNNTANLMLHTNNSLGMQSNVSKLNDKQYLCLMSCLKTLS